jgi:hypothetical protein
MCRLPIELMARIVEFTRNPLPAAQDKDVTWKHLCQPELVTLMRTSRVSSLILSYTMSADSVDDLPPGRSPPLQRSCYRQF